MSKSVRKWDIDWDAPAALVDFAKLEEGELSVAVQIINLMYVQNGPVKNDPEEIKSFIKKMTTARCKKLVDKLVDKSFFTLQNGLLSHKKVLEVLRNRQVSYENSRSFGKNGAITRWKTEQNQDGSDSPPITPPIESLPSSSDSYLKTSLPSVTAVKGSGGFSIFDLMTSEGETQARASAPGWDLRHLCRIFDAKVKSGTFTRPANPDAAFAAWCKIYTKGRPPQ